MNSKDKVQAVMKLLGIPPEMYKEPTTFERIQDWYRYTSFRWIIELVLVFFATTYAFQLGKMRGADQCKTELVKGK